MQHDAIQQHPDDIHYFSLVWLQNFSTTIFILEIQLGCTIRLRPSKKLQTAVFNKAIVLILSVFHLSLLKLKVQCGQKYRHL